MVPKPEGKVPQARAASAAEGGRGPREGGGQARQAHVPRRVAQPRAACVRAAARAPRAAAPVPARPQAHYVIRYLLFHVNTYLSIFDRES